MTRWVNFIWSQLGLTCVVGLVLLALYTSLGKQLIPLVETLDERAEQALSAQLNTPITIGEIIGDWHWFSPKIKVNDIVFGKQDQLHAESLEAELDISASLFYRSIIFKKITVAGVQLSIKQDENLDWYIGTFLLTNKDKTEKLPSLAEVEKPLWLDLLAQQGELQILNWQVSIYPLNAEVEDIELIDLQLRNKGLQHWLDGQVRIGGKGGAILNTQLEIEGDFWDLSDHKGHGFVEVEAREWKSWLPDFGHNLQLNQLVAGGKLWVEIDQGSLHSLDGYIDVPAFEMIGSGDYSPKLQLEKARLTLVGRSNDKNWNLWFNSHAQWLSDLTTSLPKGRLSYLAAEGGWQLALNDVDLETTSYVLEDFALLPEDYLEYIINLQPQGTAETLHINLLPKDDWRWSVSTSLKDTSVIGYEGIPTIENVNAYVELNATKGRASLKENDTLLNFPDLYAEYWHFDALTADVYWQIEEAYLRLVGTDINAQYQGAKIAGGFSLYSPIEEEGDSATEKNKENAVMSSLIEPQLNLALGFKNIPVSAHAQFLPPAEIPALSEWLDFNLYDGTINQGSFLFSGYVGEEERDDLDQALTVQLYLDVENARLRYLSDWPEVKNVRAKLMLDSPDVNIWIQDATTLGGDLLTNSGRIRIRSDENDVAWMSVNAEIEGRAQDGLTYLQATPLQQEVDGAFDLWQASGKLKTNFYARIPLVDDPEIKMRLSTTLEDVTLNIADVDLSISNIDGELQFDSDTGLTAKKLQAQLFGGETTASIRSTKVDDGFDIFMSAQGRAQATSIKAWQPLFLLKPVHGSLNYQSTVAIKPQARGGLSIGVNSDLAGITIETPIPFGKSANDKVPFEFSINNKQDLNLTFQYGDLANGIFSLEQSELVRGQVSLGEAQAKLPQVDGLMISGELPVEVNAQEWWDLWQSIQPTAEKNDGNDGHEQGKSTEQELAINIDVSAPNVNAFDFLMGPSYIVGFYEKAQWDLDLSSDLITGKIILPDNKPMIVNLDYIHMPVSESIIEEPVKFGSNEGNDPLDAVDPKLIPEMSLVVEEIFMGTSNYGRWDLDIKQQADHTQVHINDSLSKAFRIRGDVNWSSNELGHKTHLSELRIDSENLGDSQRAFRNAAAIESEDARFDVDMMWQGSPAHFNYATLNGNAKVVVKDGVLISDNTGALKAFGVLNFNSISRRLKLDFSDLYESGVVFDSLKARMSFDNGIATLTEPLVVASPSGKFQTSGSINFNTEEINQKLVVTFPIASSLPLVAVIAGLAPQIAGAIYITEKLIGEELEKFTSASYTVTGTIENPELKIDKAFDNELEGKESRSFKNRFLDIFGLGDD